jgi:HPt (histidine-containing phosphotransfer) domain-containing protein
MSNGHGLLDAALLGELSGGDAELAAGMVADFVETSRIDLAALRMALGAHDADEARRQAHRIKGAARIVGAHEMLRPAERIETLAGDGCGGRQVDWPAIEALAGRLSGALDRLHISV